MVLCQTALASYSTPPHFMDITGLYHWATELLSVNNQPSRWWESNQRPLRQGYFVHLPDSIKGLPK